MTQITTQAPVDAFVGEAAELTMSPAGLAILAKVGLICGPCKSVDVRTQGRLAIVRVDPRNKRDPIIPIPQVKATPEAWAALRAYFQAVMRCVGYSRLSQDDPAALHAEVVAMIPKVAAAFARYLDHDEVIRFEHWLAVSLTGTPEIRGL